MKQDFLLRARPFSLNAATYRDASVKTADYHNWASSIFHLLNTKENLDKMKQIREFFDESKHSIRLEICCVYPREEFITKADILSSRTIDVTNYEKLLTDLFFDKRFFEKPTPYGVQNLSINDKHVTEMISKKIFHEHEHHELLVSIAVVPRSF